MSNHRFGSFWMAVLCALSLLAVPGLAMAQESVDSADSTDAVNSQIEVSEDVPVEKPRIYTAKDNFGGWKFDAEILAGITNYVDDDSFGGAEPRDLHRSDPDNKDNVMINATLQLQLSYLWGKNVFIGPVLNVMTGWPMLFAGDIRIRLLVPFGQYKKDAVSASAGWGATLSFGSSDENLIVSSSSNLPKLKNYNDIYNLMYFPIELTYEHVFDNRFVLGASIQFIINYRLREYYSRTDNPNYTGSGESDKYLIKFYDGKTAVPTINSFVAGIHLGYKF